MEKLEPPSPERVAKLHRLRREILLFAYERLKNYGDMLIEPRQMLKVIDITAILGEHAEGPPDREFLWNLHYLTMSGHLDIPKAWDDKKKVFKESPSHILISKEGVRLIENRWEFDRAFPITIDGPVKIEIAAQLEEAIIAAIQSSHDIPSEKKPGLVNLVRGLLNNPTVSQIIGTLAGNLATAAIRS